MHLLYTSQTQLFLLPYRAHALCANIPFLLTRSLWPSGHSDYGGIEAWLEVFFKNKRYPIGAIDPYPNFSGSNGVLTKCFHISPSWPFGLPILEGAIDVALSASQGITTWQTLLRCYR